MRTGFKIFIGILIIAFVVMIVGPAIMSALQGGHP